MSTTVKREDLVQQLLAVQPGLSTRDIIEQSSYFILKDDHVITFNGEICCKHPTSLKGIEGAVQAAQLLDVLQKMREEEIEVDTEEGHFVIRGKRREAGIRMDSEILLPYDKVSYPTKWKKLPEDFTDAITIVKECASKDQSSFALTCVHITDKWIEASDDIHLTRYTISMGIESPILVRASSIGHLVTLDMTRFGESDDWIHFKNASGLIFSCHRYLEEFMDLTPLLEVHGQHTSFPKGLVEAAERAEIFSQEQEHNEVHVTLRPGKVKVKGSSVSGYYMESKKLIYKGDPMSFYISPKLLIELVRRHDSCEIAEERLKVDGGKFVYVSCLGKEPDNGEAERLD